MGVCCVKDEEAVAGGKLEKNPNIGDGPKAGRTSTFADSPRSEQTSGSFQFLQHSVIQQQRRLTAKERKEQTERFLNFKAAKAFKKVERFTDLYKIQKELGNGSFGSVRLGQHRKSGVPCAIKIIKKSLLSQAEVYETLMK